MNKVKHWHDEFKPDYIFLTETAAVPPGFMFKEMWKVAYPGEKPPAFFRVDPKAMGNKSNAESLPGYEEKLEEYISKRIKKKDPRIAIFDEQPVGRGSQISVQKQLTRKLGISEENIEIQKQSTPPFSSAHGWVSSDYPVYRVTEKSSVGHVGRNFRSIDEVKFTGRTLRSGQEKETRGERVIYGKEFKVKDLIHDLKLAGMQAGILIRMGKNENEYRFEEFKRQRAKEQAEGHL